MLSTWIVVVIHVVWILFPSRSRICHIDTVAYGKWILLTCLLHFCYSCHALPVLTISSRGFKDAAATKGADLEAALLKASDNGKIPIVMDTSPCLAQVKSQISEPSLRFALYEPVEFIR